MKKIDKQDLIKYSKNVEKARIVESMYKLCYNSLIDITNKQDETLIYGIWPLKLEYHCTYPSDTKQVAQNTLIKYNQLRKQYDLIDSRDDVEIDYTKQQWNQLADYAIKWHNNISKLNTMFKGLQSISQAEVIYLPNGFDSLRRCYYSETIEIANKTIKTINQYI